MQRHLIHQHSTVLDALHKLNDLSGGIMTLFVVDSRNGVLGTLTDGDIRRALLHGAQLSDAVSTVMHVDYHAIRGSDIDVRQIKACRDRGIRLVPWVDSDGTLLRIVDLSDGRSLLPVGAILMAGGKGERLRPLTLDTPKPLLRIGGKAIIDYNIEALAKCGVTDITVTTNYLADQLHEHFSAPVAGVQVKCVQEPQPLGTIGSAALADIPERGATIVMNSDLLTNISYEEMYLHHLAARADITVAVVPYQVQVPFAILTSVTEADTPETEGATTLVTGIEEKPSYSYFANAGIYIFSNEVLRTVKADTRTDATDLIQQAIDSGRRVTQYPINGTWIDVGSPADFRQAQALVKYVEQAKI